MPKERLKQRGKKRRVTFSVEASTANEVSLGGDINNWDTQAHLMRKKANGVWKKTLMLPPARYEYKFLVDGRLRNDPKNDQTCPNCFGTLNNVLIVS
jgi:1,4-alpha-glucan branching enzyme